MPNEEILSKITNDCLEIVEETYIPLNRISKQEKISISEFSDNELLSYETDDFHSSYIMDSQSPTKNSNKCICCKCSKKLKKLFGISGSLLLTLSLLGISIGILYKDIYYSNYNNYNSSESVNHYNKNTNLNSITMKNKPIKIDFFNFTTKKIIMDFDFSDLQKTKNPFLQTFLAVLISLICVLALLIILIYIYRGFVRKHLINNKFLKTLVTYSEDLPEGNNDDTF